MIATTRIIFLGFAIACLAFGFYLTGLIFVSGNLILARWDERGL